MSTVCPQCGHQMLDARSPCPRCAGLGPQRASPLPEAAAPTRGWQQTPWGRILIGLMLAQGLFYGVRQLLTGVLQAAADPGEDPWADMRNLLVLQGAQMVTLLLGGVLAGGGQRNGLVLGAVVGVWNGVLSVLLKQNPAPAVTPISLYGMPLLQAAVGAIGGWVGSLVWRPIPSETTPLPAPARKAPKPRRKSPFAGPIAWVRVVLGSALAVAGTLSAAMIFQKVLAVSGGRLATSNELQDWLITWEIKALAVLLGGALAGATTANGLKQGLVVGITAGLILTGLQARPGQAWIPVAATTAVSSLSLALVGGWFGGQLFPPVLRAPRGSRFGSSAYT